VRRITRWFVPVLDIGNNWEQVAIDCPFWSDCSVAFRFRRSVRVDVCGHLDCGVPEEPLRQLQVSGLSQKTVEAFDSTGPLLFRGLKNGNVNKKLKAGIVGS
jgi:hypothetical protein